MEDRESALKWEGKKPQEGVWLGVGMAGQWDFMFRFVSGQLWVVFFGRAWI